MPDILDDIYAMTKTVEHSGRKWVLILSVKTQDNGSWWLVAEQGMEQPAPVSIIFVPKTNRKEAGDDDL